MWWSKSRIQLEIGRVHHASTHTNVIFSMHVAGLVATKYYYDSPNGTQLEEEFLHVNSTGHIWPDTAGMVMSDYKIRVGRQVHARFVPSVSESAGAIFLRLDTNLDTGCLCVLAGAQHQVFIRCRSRF